MRASIPWFFVQCALFIQVVPTLFLARLDDDGGLLGPQMFSAVSGGRNLVRGVRRISPCGTVSGYYNLFTLEVHLVFPLGD